MYTKSPRPVYIQYVQKSTAAVAQLLLLTVGSKSVQSVPYTCTYYV